MPEINPIPRASAKYAAMDWKLDYNFLESVCDAVNDNSENAASMEEVESVILELAKRNHLTIAS